MHSMFNLDTTLYMLVWLARDAWRFDDRPASDAMTRRTAVATTQAVLRRTMLHLTLLAVAIITAGWVTTWAPTAGPLVAAVIAVAIAAHAAISVWAFVRLRHGFSTPIRA